MSKRTLIAVATAAVLAVTAGGVGVAVATSGGDEAENEKPITGTAEKQAADAALQHVGGGKVTETEVGDEESYYEVEVTRPDGSQVDVQLDRDFKVVGDETDGENERGGKDD